MRFRPVRLACTLPLAAAVLHVSLNAQAMVEYGHLAGGAANSASSMRKISPGATFKRLESALSDGRPRTRRYVETGRIDHAPQDVRPTVEPLTVLRIQWGADETPNPGGESANRETSGESDVLRSEPPEGPHDAPPDLEAAGLSSGLAVPEVSKILGDPAIQTSGLAGRGYDQKLLYNLDTGWKVTVFAARGRVTAFRATRTPKKSNDKVLLANDSVIP